MSAGHRSGSSLFGPVSAVNSTPLTDPYDQDRQATILDFIHHPVQANPYPAQP